MILRLFARFLASWSIPTLLRVGRVMGSLWFHLIPVRRGEAIRALTRAFPEKSKREIRAIAKANFQHLIISLLECIAYLGWTREQLTSRVRYEGQQEAVLGPRERGQGVVAISAHFGSFEMVTDSFGMVFQIPLVLVARLPKAGFAREMLEAFRAHNGMMEVFEPKGSAPLVVESLVKKRAALAFVVDQNIRRGRGIFVPFMGELANTTTGFASLQRKANAALAIVRMRREPDGTHELRVSPVTPSDHPNMRIAAINDTLTMSNYIQSFVRERPEQWFWVHRRWKARPQPGDLVRTDAGLERFAKGRVAAFLEAASLPADAAEPIRLLETAGIAVIRLAPGETPAAHATGLDVTTALYVGNNPPAGMRSAVPSDLATAVPRFLDFTVGADDPS